MVCDAVAVSKAKVADERIIKLIGKDGIVKIIKAYIEKVAKLEFSHVYDSFDGHFDGRGYLEFYARGTFSFGRNNFRVMKTGEVIVYQKEGDNTAQEIAAVLNEYAKKLAQVKIAEKIAGSDNYNIIQAQRVGGNLALKVEVRR